MGPERAYCGGLPRALVGLMPEDGPLGLVGSRLVETSQQYPAVWSRVVFTERGATSHDEHEEVGHDVAVALLKHSGSRQVELHFPSRDGQSLTRVVLLAGARSPAPVPPDTYGSLGDVLDAAVAEAMSSRLAVGVAEAMRAEVIARIAAAERARAACERKLDELTLSWRAARQQQITSELMEVVVGSQVATSSALSHH
jgi:hypothetical protein